MFADANMKWPLARGQLGEQLDHSVAQVYGVAYYCNRKFPFSGFESAEFINANLPLQHICGDNGERSPWRTYLQPIAATGMYIVRFVVGKSVELRQLHGLETLGVAGVTKHYMASPNYPSHQVATRMAGQTLSGFAVAAALLGLLFNLRRQILLTD